MKKVYRLATQGNINLPNLVFTPFGGLMTLDKAQHYQEEMKRGGFDVMVINTQEGKA
jgi:hypothetical protein